MPVTWFQWMEEPFKVAVLPVAILNPYFWQCCGLQWPYSDNGNEDGDADSDIASNDSDHDS